MAEKAGADGTGEGLDARNSLRKFVLNVDIRSVRAGRRFPSRASVFAKASIPESLLPVIRRASAASLTPIRTAPAVDATRGGVVSLPGGTRRITFQADATELAQALREGPKMACELWNKDPYKQDSVMGMTSVTLEPLVRQRSMEGWAPVLAAKREPSGKSGDGASTPVQVAEISVSLELEEVGYGHIEQPAPGTLPEGVPDSEASHKVAANHESPGGEEESVARRATGLGEEGARGEFSQEAQGEEEGGGEGGAACGANAEQSREEAEGNEARIRGSKEYEVAWHLEEWKRKEKERFEARMREQEQARMATLEKAWEEAERKRAEEHAKAVRELKDAQKNLEERAKRVEERESQLAELHTRMERERESERRDAARRIEEAQEAVRRVQAEGEHRLKMERERVEGEEKARKREEQRAEEAERRKENVEAELEDFRRRSREEPEARLHSELARERDARQRAERRVAKLTRSRDNLREQVRNLARSLSQAKLGPSEHAEPPGRGTLQDGRQEEEEPAAASSGDDGHETGQSLALAQGEVKRLLKERANLLATGAYERGDGVIAQLDQRISKLVGQAGLRESAQALSWR